MFHHYFLRNTAIFRDELQLFDDTRAPRSPDHQAGVTVDATKCVEQDLKRTLEGITRSLLGASIECRWVDTYFPFTHPSWELEVRGEGEEEWVEMLGCGVVEQRLLENAGAGDK